MKEYLINSILHDELKLKKLLIIDNEISKCNLTVKDIIDYIDNIKIIDNFNNKEVLIEGNSLGLLNLICSFTNESKNIYVITDDNKAINSYFIDVYNDYIEDNELDSYLDIKIQHNFKSNNPMIIGNKEFIDDTIMYEFDNYNFIIM